MNLAVVVIAITLIRIAPVKACIKNLLSNEKLSIEEHNITKKELNSSLLALFGILLSFIYVIIAPPIWMAGPNQNNQKDFEREFNAGCAVSARRD